MKDSDLAVADSGRVQGYTPGPWEVLDGVRISAVLESRTEGCGWDSHCVAMVSRGDARIDTEANARLIGSAPDLLEACLAVAAWDSAEKSGESFYKQMALCEHAFSSVRFAIAKATGGAV